MDELHEMAARNTSAELISKISRYVANIAGTNAYWHKVRDNLKAVITTDMKHLVLGAIPSVWKKKMKTIGSHCDRRMVSFVKAYLYILSSHCFALT